MGVTDNVGLGKQQRKVDAVCFRHRLTFSGGRSDRGSRRTVSTSHRSSRSPTLQSYYRYQRGSRHVYYQTTPRPPPPPRPLPLDPPTSQFQARARTWATTSAFGRYRALVAGVQGVIIPENNISGHYPSAPRARFR